MDPIFLVMRLLHVCFGVFWVGVVVFAATMLMPSIRDTGPDGGKVMLALLRRGYMTVLPVAALLTTVSGFWMYMKLMSTIGPVWAGSMSARVYGVGAVAAVVAFGLGFFIIRANALKLRVLMEAPRPRIARAAPASRWPGAPGCRHSPGQAPDCAHDRHGDRQAV
jgi:hypothetical protein